MKKLFLGSVFLIVTTVFILAVQISCQKINAQQNPQVLGSGLVLYTRLVIDQINPHTHIDSLGNVITDYIDTLRKGTFYTCNSDGTNHQLIPVSLPPGMMAYGFGSHFVNDATSITFQVGHSPVYSNGIYTYTSSPADGIYTCDLNGANITQIVSNSPSQATLCDGH